VINIKDLDVTYGPICDIYSLGVIFYIMLLRKSPFPGKSLRKILAGNRAGMISFNSPDFLRLDNASKFLILLYISN